MKSPTVSGIAVLLLIGLNSAAAQADAPESKSLSVVFHRVPADPTSSVSLILTLTLSPAASDGNAIGWSIDSANFFKPEENNGWTKWQAGPLEVLDSADGLWWTTHEDVSDPTESEFTLLPEVSGLGVPEFGEHGELFLTVAASESIPPNPEGPYESRTAYAQFLFTDGVDELDGEDDPVEIDRPRDPENQ